MLRSAIAVVVLALALTPSGDAQSLDGFERVFIPFAGANITGLGGSSFRAGGVRSAQLVRLLAALRLPLDHAHVRPRRG